jgi:hypothetical protein
MLWESCAGCFPENGVQIVKVTPHWPQNWHPYFSFSTPHIIYTEWIPLMEETGSLLQDRKTNHGEWCGLITHFHFCLFFRHYLS